MVKFVMLMATSLLSLGLAGVVPSGDPGSYDDPPPPKKKAVPPKGEPGEKGEPGPVGDLRRAYDLLRRIRADDGPAGRSDDRLRDWTGRAVAFYRKGVEAEAAGDPRLAHEYGTAAHDLARAVDHARNASRFDRPDPELPAPPEAPGPGGDGGVQARRDLRHAYDRIREADEDGGPEAKFYLDAARDLYNAARRDAEGDRQGRAGELAKAAEALTHVPEHLAHLAEPGPDAPKAKGGRPRPPEGKAGGPPPPKAKGDVRPEDELPPPLPPRD